MKKKGLFITFEGAEGSGKSTQIRKAAAYLRKKGHGVLVLREPGGTRVSEAIREVILTRSHSKMIPETELLLYLAARAQIVKEKICPALEKGILVLCDRFEDSTLAYQGYGRGMRIASIQQVSRMFVRGSLRPDAVFLLDLDPPRGFARGGRRDRMERQSLEFHRRVRRGFRALAAAEPKRWTVLDATRGIDEIAVKIREKLNHVLGKS